MRVLLISDFYPPVRGGLETHVDDLAAELSDRGHEVHVATLTQRPEPRSSRVEVHSLSTASARFVRHADGDRPFHPPVPDPVAARSLSRLMSAVKPDVVHSHTWLGVSVLRHRSAPLVITAHEYSLICQLRTLFRTDNQRCSGPGIAKCIACGRHRYGSVKSALLTTATIAGRRLLHPAAVITLSERVKEAIEKDVTAPIDVIPGMIPPMPHDAPTEQSFVPHGRFVMYAGDPGLHKGIEVLLNMWASWRPADLQLLLATTKPLALPVPPGVVVRTLSRQQVAYAWARAELAIVPSIWDEPFGMVAVEALACGTPVVASAVGALPEIVLNDVNGLLVPPGDAAQLREAVEGLVGNGGVRHRLADGALRSARRYSPEAVVPQIEAVYDRVLAAAGPR